MLWFLYFLGVLGVLGVLGDRSVDGLLNHQLGLDMHNMVDPDLLETGRRKGLGCDRSLPASPDDLGYSGLQRWPMDKPIVLLSIELADR